MQTTVTPQPKSIISLKVELTPEEFAPYIAQAVQALSSEVKLAGFRPGKAPREIVEKKVGSAAIMEQAADLAVRAVYPKVVTEKDVKSIGSPEIHVEKLAEGNPFIFTANVAVLPEVTLGDFSNLKVERKPVEVKADHADDTLKRLQRLQASEVRADRPAKMGDRVDVDFNVSIDKVPLDGGQAKNTPLTLGDKVFIPGFEDNLVGMKADEEKTFQLTFPKDYGKKDLQGKLADFKVKVSAVYDVQLPALDDAFAKRMGQFESMEQLRAKILENLKEEAESREQQRFEQAIVEAALQKSTVGEVPHILVHSEEDKMAHELQHAIEQDGGKFEDYLKSIKKTREELMHEFTPKAEQRVKVALLLRTIADANNLLATAAEVEGEISKEKLRLSNQPELVKELETEAYRDYLRMVLTNRNVIKWLTEKVKR